MSLILKYLVDECGYEFRLKYVAKRDPVKESQQCLECWSHKWSVLRVIHDKLTQLEDLGELAAHAVLQMFCLGLCHLATWEVKYFLAENKHKDSNLASLY